MRTDAFGYASGLWQDVRDVLDCGKTDLGFARLVHFLALAYIVYHSRLTGLMRRTRAFLPLCLIGRHGLPVFATGTVLSAMGEVVETRSEAFSHEVAFGAAIVVGDILMHYLVAHALAAWRDKSRAQQREARSVGKNFLQPILSADAVTMRRLSSELNAALQTSSTTLRRRAR